MSERTNAANKASQESMGFYESALALIQTPMTGYSPLMKDFLLMDKYDFKEVLGMPRSRQSVSGICNFVNSAIKNSKVEPLELTSTGNVGFAFDTSAGASQFYFTKPKGLDIKHLHDEVSEMIARAYVTTLKSWKNSTKIFPDSKSSYVEYTGLNDTSSVNEMIPILAFNFGMISSFHEVNYTPDIRSVAEDGQPKIYISQKTLDHFKQLEQGFDKNLKECNR